MFHIYVYRKKLQDFGEAKRVLYKYGPFKTKVTAKVALRRRGWKEEKDTGMWFYASNAENGSYARIFVARSGLGLISPRKWKHE